MPEVTTSSVANLFEQIDHNKNLGLSNKDRRIEYCDVRKSLEEQLQSGNIHQELFDELILPLEQIKANAQNVVMVVHKRNTLSSPGSDKVLIWSEPLCKRKFAHNRRICSSTKYSNQASSFANGTGFFLDDKVIVTAAHVLINAGYDMRNYRFIHGVIREKSTDFDSRIVVHKSQVWKPKLNQKRIPDDQHELFANKGDWAVIRVVPAYSNFLPTSKQLSSIINFTSRDFTPEYTPKRLPQIGDQVYALGHGLGLTTKLSYDGKVFRKDVNLFECNLTLLGGNSGSPVFFADDHTLAGVYMRGHKKLIVSHDDLSCLIVKHEPQFSEGQECQTLTNIGEGLKKAHY